MATRLCYLVLLFSNFVSMSRSVGEAVSDEIEAIQKEFKKINDDTAYRKVILDQEEFSSHAADGGGELLGYFKRTQVLKIGRWFGLSTGNETSEFYFKHEQFIFVYQKFQSFVSSEETGELDYGKMTATIEGRYYFNNRRLIDLKQTGHDRHEY